MTYSYGTKSWVLEHMSQGVFGRDILGKAAQVEPRTVSTWYRQEIMRLPKGRMQCNEYERGMAIALYRRAPKKLVEIAQTLRVNPDSVLRFSREVESESELSDLNARTSDALVITVKAVKKGFREFGADRFITDRSLWPCANPVFYMSWHMLDLKFNKVLEIEGMVRLGLFNKDYEKNLDRLGIGPSWKSMRNRKNSTIPSIRLNGPHKYRGAHRDGDVIKLDQQVQIQRLNGQLNNENFSWWRMHANIADKLMAGCNKN